jgi:hypothetical protein
MCIRLALLAALLLATPAAAVDLPADQQNRVSPEKPQQPRPDPVPYCADLDREFHDGVPRLDEEGEWLAIFQPCSRLLMQGKA